MTRRRTVAQELRAIVLQIVVMLVFAWLVLNVLLPYVNNSVRDMQWQFGGSTETKGQ